MHSNQKFNIRFTTPLAILSIVIIAFISYSDILSFFFSPGTLTLIQASRIQGIEDLVKIFTSPLLSAEDQLRLFSYSYSDLTDTSVTLPFYRPISKLSYSLDYSIWGIDPFGYHLTDLTLHILTSILVFFFIKSLLKGDTAVAWVSSLTFTIHPVILETVYNTTFRQDILATFFMLGSLLLLLKHLSLKPLSEAFLYCSTLFFIVSLGTKETSIILLPLIFSYLFIFTFHHISTINERLLKTLRKMLPYFISIIIFWVWRSYVLYSHGIGSDLSDKNQSLFQLISSYVNIPFRYIIHLVYPANFLRLDQNLIFSAYLWLALLLLFTAFSYRNKEYLFSMIEKKQKPRLFMNYLFISSASLLIIGIILSPYFLNNRMGPEYLHLLQKALLLGLLCITAFLALINQTHKLKDVSDSNTGKPVLFLLLWLLMLLFIYWSFNVLALRYLYASAIPFCGIIAIRFINSIRNVLGAVRESGFSAIIRPGASFRKALFEFLTIAAILLSLLAYSPLMHSYDELVYSSNIPKKLFSKLSKVIPGMPDDTVIHLYNIPGRVVYNGDIPPERVIFCFDASSVRYWLDIKFPDNNFFIYNHGTPWTNISSKGLYSEINLTVQKEQDGSIRVEYIPNAS